MDARRVMCVVGAAVAAAASGAFADQVVLEYNSVYSGYSGPVGGAPFATATFTSVTPGRVELHLAAHLAPAEFMSSVFFNVDPSLNLRKLRVSHEDGVAPGSISIRENAFKAGGGGKYDVQIEFRTSNSRRFNGTDEASFVFTSDQPITAASFNFLSAPHGGHGPFLTAAHIQGLGRCADESAWVSGEIPEEPQTVVVPVPGALLMGVPALAGLGVAGAARRRRMQR